MPISFHPSGTAEYVDRTVTSFFLADSTWACAQGDLTVGLEHDAVAPARDAQRNEHVVENRVVGDRPSEPMTISTRSRG